MKHCYFIGTSWGNEAVPQHFMALSKELVRRGHRVILLVNRQAQDIEDRVGNPAVWTWPSKRPTRFQDARFLYRLIREYRPDCLVGNFGSSNIMILVGRLMRIPCRVGWHHTLSKAIDIDAQIPKWKLQVLRLRKRIVFRFANYIVSVSNAARLDAHRTYHVPESKCRIFYNSLADPLENPATSKVLHDQNRLICVGRLYPLKGQDVVIRALARLKKTSPDVCVEFIGDGPLRESYLRLARDLAVEDKCSFPGAVPHDEVLARMASGTATIVPSRSEAFGLVNIESLAVGTPVVASRVGGIVEIVRDGVDGFLVPPGDPDALAEKLEVLLSNPCLRETMSKNARQRFIEKFEQSKVVSEQAQWFEEIVAKAHTI